MARVCFLRMGAWPLFLERTNAVFGGAEVRAVTFAKQLAELGRHQVSFAMAAHPQLAANSLGMRVIGLPGRRRIWQKFRSSVRRRISSHSEPFPYLKRLDADLVLCFGIHDPSPSVVAAARNQPSRTILFLTSSADVQPVQPTNAKMRRHQERQEFAIRYADWIVVQTEFQRSKLQEHYGRPATLIRNPIDCDRQFDKQEQPNGVLWVGRADRDSKRADICLSVARQCPQHHFTLVMNDSSSADYRELADSAPSNVTLHRHVPLSQIEQLFARAAILLNTSNSEGFPNTFLQAAKYGVPILSLRVDPDGMLSRHGCGIVAGSESGVVKHLQAWRRLESELEPGAGVRYVREHHELRACTEQLDSLIQSIHGQRQAA